jgi:hypothetical protein
MSAVADIVRFPFPSEISVSGLAPVGADRKSASHCRLQMINTSLAGAVINQPRWLEEFESFQIAD